MTIETCNLMLERAKAKGDEEEVKFWEERIARKIARHDKYAHLRGKPKTEVNKDEKPKG